MPGFWDWLKGIFTPSEAVTPAGPPPVVPTGAVAPVTSAPLSPPAAPSGVGWVKKADPSYDTPALLALSPSDWRRQALKVEPWKTAWIGRVDVIPPQSDPRTALIDRGLMLRGSFTAEELAAIHEVGDLWLLKNEQDRRKLGQVHQGGEAAVAALKAQRAERRAQKQAEAAERRRQRSEAIARRRQEDILYLGRGVSRTLGDHRAHVERLASLGLPLLCTPGDLAAFLGIPVPRLRWLAFHQQAALRSHYIRFKVPKRAGGVRILHAPHAQLKQVQHRILSGILEKSASHPAAHGFVRGHSTLSNARPHVGQPVVVCLDIQDFFPSISIGRVRKVFEGMGFSPSVASILALLCTEAPRQEVRFEGTSYHVAVGPRCLPQGAPTSPALSNLVALQLDRRMAGLAQAENCNYSRYADDLVFSGINPGRCINLIKKILLSEGFTPHPAKTRIMRQGGRQQVTGLVVNHHPSLPREEVRQLRAVLHNARRSGLASQNRESRPHFGAWLRGRLAYLSMVDPEKGKRMLAQLDELESRG